jgi:hypothetical protein
MSMNGIVRVIECRIWLLAESRGWGTRGRERRWIVSLTRRQQVWGPLRLASCLWLLDLGLMLMLRVMRFCRRHSLRMVVGVHPAAGEIENYNLKAVRLSTRDNGVYSSESGGWTKGTMTIHSPKVGNDSAGWWMDDRHERTETKMRSASRARLSATIYYKNPCQIDV